MAVLGEELGARLETEMQRERHEYPYRSWHARKHYGAGHEQGRAEEAARAVLAVFEPRGMDVPDDVRARIHPAELLHTDRLRGAPLAAVP